MLIQKAYFADHMPILSKWNSVNNENAVDSKVVIDLVQQLLLASNYQDIRSLSVDYRDGILTLRGQVSSWYRKQLAQELVRHVTHVQSITNAITVQCLDSKNQS